ncbi:uncharacterized protein J4E78_006165 [Alternaria triticimaculans]|uniref:uncharacterized protein n=1 Tax=Alternaria triticimaculans TaxID=297637 RepID=UPI0020C3A6C5|nr:uncharacterized protein J4E78_006165 [Alternaria triticimaculans]KAI4657777.1 hypothetical protein J4E78_006165 [Alternaria triticimaculans]
MLLITALPLSLRQIAATNIPAVSSILWEEFLDDNRPQWFEELPYDIQSYFIQEFGPATAAPPASEALPTVVTASPTASPSETASNLSAILCDISIRKFEHDSYAYGIFEQCLERNLQFGILLWDFFRIFDHTGDLITIIIVIFRIHHLNICILILILVLSRKFISNFEPNDRSCGTSFQRRWPDKTRKDRTWCGTEDWATSRFVEDMNWEDDGYDPAPMSTAYHGHQIPPAAAPTPSQANNIATAGIPHPNDGNSMPSESTPMAMQDNHTPILAPALNHSHSSNRARGRRTSYKSLHSVAEVTEPDEELNGDSPVLGRNNSPPKTGPRRPSMSALDTLPVPAVASIKRKPVPTSPISSPAAEASRGLLRPSLAYNSADHSGSSSSGLAVSSLSSNSGHGYQSDDSGPISPITHQQPSSNPFAGGYAYLEDYGPEYSNNGYTDQDDELYGGHRSFDRYPDPSSSLKKSSKTEWPLRNVMGGGQKRTRSPMWDRVYERV